MSFCNSECADDILQIAGSGCEIITRPAGIKRVIFGRCDITFLDLQDLDEWAAKLTANEIHATGDILGSKPKGSTTKKKLASCRPQQVTGGTKSIAFTDSNSDNTNFTDYAFYNSVQLNSGGMVFGYITCDDLFYGWFSDFSAEVDDVRSESNEEEMVFDMTLEYNAIQMMVPVLIPGLDAILN